MPSLAHRIRTAREAHGLSPADIAAKVIPAQVGDCDEARERFARVLLDLEAGTPRFTSPEDLREIGAAIGISSQELDAWHAEAGHLPPDLENALLEDPLKWDAVRAFLAGRVGLVGPPRSLDHVAPARRRLGI